MALASYDQALAVRPEYAYALNSGGTALLALGRSEEALASYDRALTIRPDFAVAHKKHATDPDRHRLGGRSAPRERPPAIDRPAHISAAPGCRLDFVSVQEELRAGDEAVLKDRNEILHFGGALSEFSETTALISCLDLVISVDTSVAHLAGAMGRPVWVLLRFTPDWRWLLDRDSSPWYPRGAPV